MLRSCQPLLAISLEKLIEFVKTCARSPSPSICQPTFFSGAHRATIDEIIVQATSLLAEQPNIPFVELQSEEEIYVCGDTHGQLRDTLHIFSTFGPPLKGRRRYLFNGNFTGRGKSQLQNTMLLLALHVLEPETILLNRGSYETASLAEQYGFAEAVNKLQDGKELFAKFRKLFNSLPVAHVLNRAIFVVHGGLFSDADEVRIGRLQTFNRFKEPSGLFDQMLWNEPRAKQGRGTTGDGVVQFGPDVTKKFLESNGLSCLIRSHQPRAAGYSVDQEGFCATVFSASCYCGWDNSGAVAQIVGGKSTMFRDVRFFPHKFTANDGRLPEVDFFSSSLPLPLPPQHTEEKLL